MSAAVSLQEIVEAAVNANRDRIGALLPVLHAIQDKLGHVPPDAVPMIANALNLSRAEVHGVISFYHDFRTEPPGEHTVHLCRAEACQAMGARELEQIARWVTDDVYRHLLKRVVLSTRARQARGETAVRPTFAIGGMRVCEPRDGVIEATVIVRGRARTRAVAIRLEGLDHRWRASAIHVL